MFCHDAIAPKMNSALEFHDSTVQSLEIADGMVRVIFDHAYIHRSQGAPGIDPGQGDSQPLELVISDGECSPLTAECCGVISDGFVKIGAQALTLLPIPCVLTGDIVVQLDFGSGKSVTITGRSLHGFTTGKASFVETFDGLEGRS